jgi:2-polyprenyl-6-methoxyphenol hydroxylase-like FAD-dependent oxidoreductase
LFRVDHTLDAKGSAIFPAYLEAGGNPQLAASLRQAQWREGSFSAVAGFALGHQSLVPGLLRLGDAESVIPPFTGNGMTMALQSAESACGPMVAWAVGDLTWQAAVSTVRTDLTRRFKRRLAVARFLHRILFDDTGRSLLHALSSAHLLPFRPIHALVR